MMEYIKSNIASRGLIHLLRHGDRNSMSFSIENRVPFLTNDFVEMILSMPENFLISNYAQTKFIFREAMRGIVPDQILNRKDKIGFETPNKDWVLNILKSDEKVLENLESISFININELKAMVNNYINGNSNLDWQVWRWINFSLWLDLYKVNSN